MRRSPLHDKTAELGARFTGFGGWEMPLQYDSVLAEHRSVRSNAAFFDVTHLGRFELTGSGARAAVDRLLCNKIEKIAPGRCQYTMILNEDGGVIDDLIVWWWEEERFWVLPNAANHERVMALFAGEPSTIVTDLRETTVMIAVQGPQAPTLLESVLGVRPRRFHIAIAVWRGTDVAMAGTGYTGEQGAELCLSPEVAPDLIDALVAVGVAPAGLGARDTLRLEAGLSLWGEDIDETVTPLEAGLGQFVSFDHDFVGKKALFEQQQSGVPRSRVAFVLDGRGVPRHGYKVRTASGSTGEVTSGNMSPILGRGIGLALVGPPPQPDEPIEVEIRDRYVPATQTRPPFHLLAPEAPNSSLTS